ncbi:MAG: DUF2934 domain-containing protein [Candidatus Omnitrophica bacterium]|nr:DUF2934 domain-containing protein [Candidatus Omnitrophota bacterium]
MAAAARLFGTDRHQKAQRRGIDAQEVARVAYGLYEQRGRENGHAIDDWLKAEAIVREQHRLRG